MGYPVNTEWLKLVIAFHADSTGPANQPGFEPGIIPGPRSARTIAAYLYGRITEPVDLYLVFNTLLISGSSLPVRVR